MPDDPSTVFTFVVKNMYDKEDIHRRIKDQIKSQTFKDRSTKLDAEKAYIRKIWGGVEGVELEKPCTQVHVTQDAF